MATAADSTDQFDAVFGTSRGRRGTNPAPNAEFGQQADSINHEEEQLRRDLHRLTADIDALDQGLVPSWHEMLAALCLVLLPVTVIAATFMMFS